MAGSSELINIPGMTKEMRESVIAAFDELSSWREEIEVVNERSLRKVLDRTSAVAKAMGWPDQAIRSTREHLETASKAQTELIDQIMEAWKQQLKSPTAPLAFPRNFMGQVPHLSASPFGSATPEFNPLAPWTFWLQAAEMWQRAWLPDAAGRRDRSH